MEYSIFKDTMANMNYSDIEKIAKENPIVLFPIGVIEEHGPHLPLGTDVYLSYSICSEVKKQLEKLGTKAIIVPPFYWGINSVTGSFSGSFTVRRSTMKAMLVDNLLCLKNWGFEHIYLFNFHGDFEHYNAIFESINDARLDYGVNAFSLIADFMLSSYDLKGDESFLAVYKAVKPKGDMKSSDYIDFHAGALETGLMLIDFPELVNKALADTLPSSKTTADDFKIWRKGWGYARRITPSGYCGSPSEYNINIATQLKNSIVTSVVELLKNK